MNYPVVYRRGKDNLAADHLSRHPKEVDTNVNDENEYFERFVYSIQSVDPWEDMRIKQSEDQLQCNLANWGLDYRGSGNFFLGFVVFHTNDSR